MDPRRTSPHRMSRAASRISSPIEAPSEMPRFPEKVSEASPMQIDVTPLNTAASAASANSSPVRATQSNKENGGLDEMKSPLKSATSPVHPSTPAAANASAPLKRGQLAKDEERRGTIQCRHVTNDNCRDSLILMTGLKNIYQKQLPKMPREYIARLVYDRNHDSMAIVKKGLRVVGGITYRVFNDRKFAEIVFCAITSSEQVKGYGSYLMNNLKAYVRKTTDVDHFLTYADNYAVGYFKKQGFTADVTLDRSIWAGFIKDYEGGTIMQCTMLPRINYLMLNEIIEMQKKAVYEKIQAVTNDTATVYPGLTCFKEGVKSIEAYRIPGLIEAGWTPEMETHQEEKSNPLYPLLRQLLNDLQAQTWAWPFREPVDPEIVPDYYVMIKEPMDLKTMEHRLDSNYYKTLEAFVADFDKIVGNCKKFNDAKTVYVKCATKLDAFFKNRLRTVREMSQGESSSAAPPVPTTPTHA